MHRSSRRSFLRSTSLAAGAMALGTTGPAMAMEGLVVEAGAAGRALDALTEPLRLARVWATQHGQLDAFDDTHRVFDDGSAEILLWPGDLARLVQTGLRFEITVPDLIARDRAIAAQPVVRTAAVQPGETATGDYRFLDDYNAEMMALADENPDLVELITLPFESLEGRTIYGLEIAEDVSRKDGRPVYYNDGIHHAREWPAAEVPIMWAYDLVETFRKVEAGEEDVSLLDRRIHRLVQRTRNVIVPVVNVDGFRFSRAFIGETGERNPTGIGTLGGNGAEAASNGFGAYWRKNMHSELGEYGTLPENPVLTQTILALGVDPNRNYSYQWGGNGSSASRDSGTYRGPEPFSEPESRNVQFLHQRYQCIAGITHHTSGDLVLWAWGDTADDAPDDALLARLGFACGSFNQYRPTKSIDLYVTTGTCSDYTYGTYGSVSYTFEHAGSSFHPPYGSTVPAMYAKNREALALIPELVCLEPEDRDLMLEGLQGQAQPGSRVPDTALEYLTGAFDYQIPRRLYSYDESSALDPLGRHHTLITGSLRAPDGSPLAGTIRLRKDFENFLWFLGNGGNPTGETHHPELVDAEIQVLGDGPDAGTFRWVVNPSTRPFIEATDGPVEAIVLTAEVDGAVVFERELRFSRGEVIDLGDLLPVDAGDDGDGDGDGDDDGGQGGRPAQPGRPSDGPGNRPDRPRP